MRAFLRSLICTALICSPTIGFKPAPGVTPAGASRRPLNVLLIMSDQHNAHALGSYGNGFGGVAESLTPSLDQLALEGVRFTRAFCAAPQCVPARETMLTGQWPHKHGVKWNGIFGTHTYETFPSLGRKVGYETISIGKDHLYWTDTDPIFNDYGFNAFVKKRDYFAYCQDNHVPAFLANGNFVTMPNLPGAIVYAGETFNANNFHREGFDADQTIAFLEARAGDGAPFICEYMPWGPHAPLVPSGTADPNDWAHKYHPFDGLGLPPNFDKVASTQALADIQATYSGLSDDEWREILSYYYGLISQVDYNVGRVLTRLDELGMAEDTLVIYTADHGEFSAEMHTWTKGRFHYDNINRVPMIARLPGVLPAGKVVDSLVSSTDVFPTIMELTGIPIGDARRSEVDGVSLVELMVRDGEPAGWRQEVFSELGTEQFGKTRMVRTQTAKFIYDEEYDEEELYDLTVDPWEIQNVVSDPAYAALRTDLKGRLDSWWNNEQGHLPDYRPNASNAAPSPPRDPIPQHTSNGVARDVDPSWLPSTAAHTQEVYLGTDPDALTLFTTLTHMDASFNPGTLAPLTTYYWRVDGSNENGTTTGDRWRFKTSAGGSGGPGLAGGPVPARNAEDVSVTTLLSWTPAPDAASQQLSFGPVGAGVPIATYDSSVSSFDPGPLEPGAEYEWRVDQTDAAGTTAGDTWTFTTTTAGLPDLVHEVFPLHLSPAVPPTELTLHWESGNGATFHDVHFGTSFPLPLVAQTTETSYSPGPLASDTTYYWRIDGGNALGTHTGPTWRFVTGESVGNNYCTANPNSAGRTATILATGSTVAADNDFRLHAIDAPPNKFGIFFYGASQVQIPFGEGFRCIGGLVQRLQPVLQTDGVGRGSRTVDLTSEPAFSDITLLAPITMNFQFWHRDNMGSSNLTDGIEVGFQ